MQSTCVLPRDALQASQAHSWAVGLPLTIHSHAQSRCLPERLVLCSCEFYIWKEGKCGAHTCVVKMCLVLSCTHPRDPWGWWHRAPCQSHGNGHSYVSGFCEWRTGWPKMYTKSTGLHKQKNEDGKEVGGWFCQAPPNFGPDSESLKVQTASSGHWLAPNTMLLWVWPALPLCLIVGVHSH
jgi:hypothetical protein